MHAKGVHQCHFGKNSPKWAAPTTRSMSMETRNRLALVLAEKREVREKKEVTQSEYGGSEKDKSLEITSQTSSPRKAAKETHREFLRPLFSKESVQQFVPMESLGKIFLDVILSALAVGAFERDGHARCVAPRWALDV